jgi:RNA ligase (TIGR02306 family)
MAKFEVKLYKLKIEPHPNADAIELARVGDFLSVVKKDQFKTGDLGVYIPEGAVCPDWLIERLGLTGKLAGSQKNRVKAMKLRGILSQGLVYPVRPDMDFDGENYYTDGSDGFVVLENGQETDVVFNEDLASVLGITKYEPPIPVHMSGEVFNAFGKTLSYDIENIKKFPDVIAEGEMVVITEKLHGTWTCFGVHGELPDPIVTSKGISAQGLAFKINDANADNLYIRSLVNSGDAGGNDVLDRLEKFIDPATPAFYVLGETYGKGVQDLEYGLSKPHFRAFDIYVGEPGQGKYLSGLEFMELCDKAQIERVPVLYNGPFTKDTLLAVTNGKDSVTGTHMREGVVVRPLLEERYTELLGRVILKSISEAYLLRKGNATEFN